MTTLEDLKQLSLEDLAALIKKNYKSLLGNRAKMKMLMKLYSQKLDEVKKPVKNDYSKLYEDFMKGGETDGNIKSK